MKFLKVKLVPILFGGAALVAVASSVGLVWGVGGSRLALVGCFFAGGIAILAIAVMVRRLSRAQQQSWTKVRAGIAHQQKLTLGVLERLSESEQRIDASVGVLAEEVRAIKSGPDWSQSEWDEIATRLAPGKSGIEQVTRRWVNRDASALLALHKLVDLRGEPPAATGYVSDPETLLALVSLVMELPDGAVVVETGSGVSTVWLALAAVQSGRRISIISLEHSEKYAEESRVAVSRQHVSGQFDVRIAPLADVTVDGTTHSWYEERAWADISRIDVLFVDGPPGYSGPNARFPAFPLLEHALVDDAIVILDDTDRAEERKILRTWASSARLGSLSLERELDRTSFLRYRKHQSGTVTQRIDT